MYNGPVWPASDGPDPRRSGVGAFRTARIARAASEHEEARRASEMRLEAPEEGAHLLGRELAVPTERALALLVAATRFLDARRGARALLVDLAPLRVALALPVLVPLHIALVLRARPRDAPLVGQLDPHLELRVVENQMAVAIRFDGRL